MTPPTHLTAIPGATVLAWHASDDLQAVRMSDGSERLFLNGIHIPFAAEECVSVVQQIIGYCHMGKRQQKLVRQHWLALA